MDAQDATVRGWGPDYTEITAYCPERGCSWEHTWSDTTTLGDIIDVIGTHLHEAHG